MLTLMKQWKLLLWQQLLQQQLQQQLDDTSRALAAAQAGYDQCADQDLLEYYLYEISALRAKHTYLLRQRREP